MEKVVRTIPKNSLERIEVGVSEFKGHDLAYVRIYYLDDDKQWKPGKKGLTIRIELLPKVIQGLLEAQDEAFKAGLLEEEDLEVGESTPALQRPLERAREANG